MSRTLLRHHTPRVALDERGLATTGRVGWLAIAAVATVTLVDGGSVFLTRLQAGDQIKDVGRAAVEQTEGKPVSQAVALAAYNRAVTEAAEVDGKIEQKTFLVNADSSITFTMTKSPSTIVAHYLPPLRPYLTVKATWTQQPLEYGNRA